MASLFRRYEINPTHNMITFTRTKNLTYKINDAEFSKDDLCLLLQMNGLDVIEDLPDGEFFVKCLHSLSQLAQDDQEEFYLIFNDFINYTEQDKAWWRKLIQARWLRTVYSNSN